MPEAPAAAPNEVSLASGRRRVARRAKEPEKKKSRAPLAFVLVLLVAVAGFGYWKLRHKPPPSTGPDPVALETEALKTLFQDGKNLVRKGRWGEAAEKFNQVIAARPDFGDGAVKTYLAAAEKEVPNQKHFDDAAAALDRNEIGNAHRALLLVSADTQQLARRDDLQARKADLFKARVLEAQGLVSAGGEAKMKKLKALAEDLLVAKPEDRDALEFKAIADRALRARPEVKLEILKDDPANQVRERYASGDAGGAYTEAAACAAESESCKLLEAKMTELTGLLKRVEALEPNELVRGLQLDREISGGKSSPQARPLGTRIASIFYKKASSARTVGDWGQAMQNALKVLDAEPAHAGAQAMVSDGRERAKDLYLRCYQQRQTEPEQALPLCNEVVSMLPAGDSLREKAERVLQALKAR